MSSDDDSKENMFFEELKKKLKNFLKKELKKLTNSKASVRVTNGKEKKFSPKYYKSGWGGGSRAKIKTYKVAKIAKGALFLLEIGEIIDEIVKGEGEEVCAKIGSKVFSFLLAKGGAIIGKIIGSYFPGIGNLIGGGIGKLVGGFIGKHVGEWVGRFVYYRIQQLRKEYMRDENCAGNNNLSGGGKTGGIEFEIPKEILNMRKILYFNKGFNHSIVFKTQHSNLNEILNVANRFLILRNEKFTSINQVFQTILTEIYGGFIGNGILPYVSLNFNNNSLLYSIMPNYYKKTLTGNILGYLDYFLKGFVNGGFFEEEFTKHWYKYKNTDFNHLNSNFINLKKYIFQNKSKISNHDLYLTVYDLGEDISEENNNNAVYKNSLSAFRIIGIIKNDIFYNKGIIIPNCSFRTESDFNIFDQYKKEMKDHQFNIPINKEKSNDLEKTQDAIKKMKTIINILMPQIPHFRGYFHILDMITFAIHYISTLDANAVFPDFSESFLFKAKGKSYVSLLPPVFPPLPIKKQQILTLNLTFTYAINNFLNDEERRILNNELSQCALNNVEINIMKIEQILNTLEIKYKNYLISLLNKEEIEYRSRRELKINEFITKIQSIFHLLIETPKTLFTKIYETITKTVETNIKEFNKLMNTNYSYTLKKINLNNIENIEQKKEEIKLLINEFRTIMTKFNRDLISKIDNNIEKERRELQSKMNSTKETIYKTNISELNNSIEDQKYKTFQNFKNNLEVRLNSEKNSALNSLPYNIPYDVKLKIESKIEEIREKELNDKKYEINRFYDNLKSEKIKTIKKEIEKKTNEMINQAYNTLNQERNRKINLLNNELNNGIDKQINDFNNNIKEIENNIKNKTILNYGKFYDKIYLVEKINLSLMGYYNEGLKDKNVIMAPIKGGCLSEINNKLKIEDISELEIFNNLYNVLNQKRNCEEIQFEGINYININISLIQGNLNENFCRTFLNYNGLSEATIIEKISKNQPIDIVDEFGNGSGIYRILIQQSEKINNRKEIEQKNIFGENLAFYLNNDDDDAVDKIIELGENSVFETETENNLNPFLISVMNKNRDLSNNILNHISTKTINSSNETKITPLHYACLYNYSELADSLIKNGANINAKTRENGDTPLDILVSKGNYETLEILLKDRNIYNSINNKNNDNSTPFHTSCIESMICTKLLLKNRNKFSDKNGNTPEHYAFFSGRIDIYNLIASSDIKEFNQYISSIRDGDIENLNEERMNKLDTFDLFLNCLNDNLKKGNISNLKKLIKFYQKNQRLRKQFKGLKSDILNNIIINVCNGRNPLLLELISEIIEFENIPVAAYIGKFGLISYIIELKNMNINMFSEIEGKGLLDFAIESKNEDIILEFFKQVDFISDENLSKYLTKILYTKAKLFDSTYSYILSEEKFAKNKINFNYLYNKDALPKYFRVFLKLDIVDQNSLNFQKIQSNCRDSVICALKKDNQIIKQFEIKEKKEEMNKFEELLKKYSSSKFDFETFEHDVSKVKSLLMSLQNYNLLIQHRIIKSKKIWMLKYLPKDFDLFTQDDRGNICFEEISQEFSAFDLLLKIFIYRENNKEKQMFYFLKVLEIILNKCIKKLKKEGLEIIIKMKIIKLIECFEEKTEYLKNYYNDHGNNLLLLISKTFFIDKELENKILKFIDIIKVNSNKNEFMNILNQQNNLGNTFLFNFIEQNNSELAMKIFIKYYNYFDISIRNYEGNSFLHYMMSLNYYDKNILDLITKIIKSNKYLIISSNNYGLTPFHFAAKNKCNDSLYLMSNYFPLDQIEAISNNGNLIHYAAISNCISTLRLLIEVFKVDINAQIHSNNLENKEFTNKKLNDLKLPDKGTPIYCAAYYSCVDSFDYLLSLGANPFIQDKNGKDAIDIGLINGNKEMVEFISNKYSFINSNGKYLLSLVQNIHARDILYKNFFFLGVHNINISNSIQQNLLMLAVLHKNYKIISFLLSKNINIENIDIFGRNILHYCIISNSLTSCWTIFSFLYTLKKKDKLYNLIYKMDNDGETPLYTACRFGRLEIVYFILLYIEINQFPKKLMNNHIGLLPIHIAIINNFYTIALLIEKFFNLSTTQIKNISEEHKNKIDLFFSSDLQKEKKKVEEIFQLLQERITDINEYSLDGNNLIKIEDNNLGKEINLKTFENFEDFFPNCLSNEIFIKLQDLFSVNLLYNLYELYLNDNYSKDVKKFFNILSSVEIKGNIKLSIQWKIIFLFTTYIIPNEYFKISQINNYLENLLSNEKLINLNPSHPIFYWIDSIIISGCEGECLIAVEDLLDILTKFINIILGEERYLNNLMFVRLSMKAFQFIDYFNKIMTKLNKEFGVIQLKYLHCIPPLIENDINDLLNKYPIIHQDYNNRIPIFSFIKDALSKRKISSNLLEACLVISDSIIKSSQISYIAKEEILSFCRTIFNNYFNNENLPNALLTISSISENLCSKFGLNLYKNTFLYIIQKNRINNLNDLVKIFHEFLQVKDLEEFNNYCKYLKTYSLSKFFIQVKSIKSKTSGRNLTELLEAFKNEKYSLSDKEINQLKLFGEELEKTRDYIQTEFITEGRNLGLSFKNNPTIENFSKLVKIVNCGIFEVMKLKPYLIQNLIVFSFYLHYINNNSRSEYKGRLGQILTGEGKSLIIAEIALISALMGEFVDIITSTSYLAERDQLKFKELYKIFGISSNSITENNPRKEAYNGIILYGTNTDFEFSLLREGTNCEEKMFTVPIGEKVEIKRKYETVIVDESDNLFIDTALNSARIAYTSRNHYNWVYFPILNCVKNNIKNSKKVREVLEKINLEQSKRISDSQLNSWIQKAETALEFKKGEKYVVRYNEEKGKKEVQIIQLSTGRVNIGSRWSNGLHEFVEVKEGLEPETENNTIASISHPSFFKNYNIIFGLTGTIGSDIERNEILQIYKLDSFDAPPNFSSQRKLYPKTIFEDKDSKEENIILQIRNMISKNRPVLILLLTIDDTIHFSNKLKNEGINNLILNDIQKEKEDYIILYAGKSRSVVVATNAAGRGTDIILSEESLNYGGLHVIMGFFPENSRVEFQGIGRAGRQGQMGSAQVIFSKDEKYFEGEFIDSVDDAENYRNNKLIGDSKIRIIQSFFELDVYNVLKLFFLKLREFNMLLENESFQICFQEVSAQENMNYDSFKKGVIEKFKIDWAEFFSKISKRNFGLKNEIDFYLFLSIYGWENLNVNKPKFWKSFIQKEIKHE